MGQQGMFLAVILCLSLSRYVYGSQQVINDMSKNFGGALEVCKSELNLPDTIYDDFVNFWREDHEVTNRDTGCAVMCLSTKLELVDPELNLHHGNAHEFALKHGADDQLAKELVNIVHECGKGVADIADSCMRALGWAKCFKMEIHKRNMAPPVEVVVAEVLAEV